MIFTALMPFAEALEALAVKTLLPTELRTAMLSTIPAELRARSMMSAGQTSAEFLQRALDGVTSLAEGKSDRATQRMELKRLLGSLGAEVDETDLTDIRSDARLNLILDTNLQQAQGYGHKMQGRQNDILAVYPAQELVRVQDAAEPRDWAARWAAAGGTFYGGRMIALKSDPIWKAINRFGVDYPPFDFNSGMELQDVDRKTAVAAGLMKDDDVIDVESWPSDSFNADVQAKPEVRDSWLRTALADNLQGVAEFDAAGVLRLVAGGAA